MKSDARATEDQCPLQSFSSPRSFPRPAPRCWNPRSRFATPTARTGASCCPRLPRLRVVARAGVGLDNVDVDAATKAGVMVVNAPSSNIVSAAEHAVALLLALARNIPQAMMSLKDGKWKRSAYTGVELQDMT